MNAHETTQSVRRERANEVATNLRTADVEMPTPASSKRRPDGSFDEGVLLNALRSGDEAAFASLVERLHRPLVSAAIRYVRDPAAAEDVVQTTWMGFCKSLDRFQGRCSIKTWLFRILFNNAQTRVNRDQRLVPFSALVREEAGGEWSSVEPSWFRDAADPVAPGHWVQEPPSWTRNPDQLLSDKETIEIVQRAMDDLPPAQATVMQLRDVQGLSSREVCNALSITETNQRVLLHRARTRVRKILSTRYGSDV